MANEVVYTPLNDLKENDTEGKRVKVLVLKKWRVESKSAAEVWSLDLHLMDENGNQLQARAGKKEVDRFNGAFLDGHIYSIQRFTVAEQKNKYRIVDCNYLLWLNRFSIVQQLPLEPSSFPGETFNFLPFENVVSRLRDPTLYTAVIGRLVSASNVIARSVNEGGRTISVPMREVGLANARGTEMKITMWSDLVNVIEDGVLDAAGNTPIVMIITGTYVREHQGVISLCTSAASRALVDLDVQQVRDFKGKLNPTTAEISKVDLREEEDPNTKKVTVFDLTEKLQYAINKDTTHYCEARVVGLEHDKPWYYFACKSKNCNRKVEFINGQGSCSKCGGGYSGAVPWYLLHLKVTDDTKTVTFTVIGSNAEKMLDITAEEHYKISDPDKAFKVFDKIIGKTFVFKVSISGYNITNQSDNFKVSKVLNSAPENEKVGEKGVKRSAGNDINPITPQKLKA